MNKITLLIGAVAFTIIGFEYSSGWSFVAAIILFFCLTDTED